MTYSYPGKGKTKRCLRLTVHGDPTPKARARHYMTSAGRVGSFTPAKTAAAQRKIQDRFVQDVSDNPLVKFTCYERTVPLEMQMTFYRRRPKSAPKKREYPTTKPDLDNYIKTVMDALQGFAFENDSQIIKIHSSKLYSDDPRVVIEISKVGEEEWT